MSALYSGMQLVASCRYLKHRTTPETRKSRLIPLISQSRWPYGWSVGIKCTAVASSSMLWDAT